MTTQTKKNTTKTSVAKTTRQDESPLKITKKQRESFKIHEKAAKLGGELAKAGILKPYKKNKHPIFMTYKYIIDTGVLSRYYRNEIKLPIEIFSFGCISIVTKIELYNWLSGYKIDIATRRQMFTSIKDLKVIHFNENISKLVEEYADKHIHLKTPDAIIGATAMYYDLELHTRDKHDFDIFVGIRKKYYPQKKIAKTNDKFYYNFFN